MGLKGTEFFARKKGKKNAFGSIRIEMRIFKGGPFS